MKRFFSNSWVTCTLLWIPIFYGCGAKMDGRTLEGKAAILDETYKYLSSFQCDKAIETIEGLYNSPYSDNQVRLARASAYGCKAGMGNFFDFVFKFAVEGLGTTAGEGSSFYRAIAKLFYSNSSSTLDERIQASKFSMGALLATLKTGRAASESSSINWDTDNVGSLYASDRTDDSNLYLAFVAMAAMGAIQDRYSQPNTANWKKGQKIGYTAANTGGYEAAVQNQGTGCLYASALLNMFDALEQVATSTSGSVKTALSNVTALKSGLDLACEAGCNGSYASTGCSLTAGLCYPCPLTLRNWDSCTGLVTDKNSCAAAGIVRFINTDTSAGWVGP